MFCTDRLRIAAGVALCVPITLAIELNAGCPLNPAVAGAVTVGVTTAEIVRRIVGGGEPPHPLDA